MITQAADKPVSDGDDLTVRLESDIFSNKLISGIDGSYDLAVYAKRSVQRSVQILASDEI